MHVLNLSLLIIYKIYLFIFTLFSIFILELHKTGYRPVNFSLWLKSDLCMDTDFGIHIRIFTADTDGYPQAS